MDKNTAPTVKNRESYLDILRLFACFLVCFNHSQGFHAYMDPAVTGIPQLLHIPLSVVTSMNIPLFFTLSGALLLKKEEGYRSFLSKRVLRFVVLLAAASLAVYLAKAEGPRTVKDFFFSLLREDIQLSYWYLYAYLSFLLALPFLRKIAWQLTGRDMAFLLCLRTLFVFLPEALGCLLPLWGREPLPMPSHLNVLFAWTDYLYYPLFGYYLSKEPSAEANRPSFGGCPGVFCAAILVSSFLTFAEGIRGEFSQTYLGAANFIAVPAFFMIIRHTTKKRSLSAKTSQRLAALSSLTLGIYLWEPIVSLLCYQPFFDLIEWHPILSTPFSLVWSLFCMVTGGLCTWALRKLPGLRKYL